MIDFAGSLFRHRAPSMRIGFGRGRYEQVPYFRRHDRRRLVQIRGEFRAELIAGVDPAEQLAAGSAVVIAIDGLGRFQAVITRSWAEAGDPRRCVAEFASKGRLMRDLPAPSELATLLHFVRGQGLDNLADLMLELVEDERARRSPTFPFPSPILGDRYT